MVDPARPPSAALGMIGRFVTATERDEAVAALAYATALATGRLGPDAVFDLCYEMAAQGIPHYMWPDMVMAEQLDHTPGADEELRRVRRDALAMSLIDRGENETIRRSARE